LKILFSHMPWETEKSMKNLSQDNRRSGWDWNFLFREHSSRKVTACVQSLGDAKSTNFRNIRYEQTAEYFCVQRHEARRDNRTKRQTPSPKLLKETVTDIH
jgi:hypothetical protein